MKHHALVYVAASLADSTVPETYLQQSVDVQHIIGDRFGIDDARALTMQASQSAVGADGRAFVIVTQNILPEAQNALLKLFEEPPAAVSFHLVVPQEGILIPTLRSRVQVVQGVVSEESPSFDAFLAATLKERMDTVAALAKKKDVAEMDAIVDGALRYAGTRTAENIELAKSVSFVAAHMKAPGASRKMLLEELALSLPCT